MLWTDYKYTIIYIYFLSTRGLLDLNLPGYWLRKLKLFSGFFNTDSIDFDEAVYLQNRLDAMHGHTFNVAGVLRNLAPKCKDLLLECYWAGQPLQCEEELKAVPSPKGYCCVFNYHYERYVQLKKIYLRYLFIQIVLQDQG